MLGEGHLVDWLTQVWVRVTGRRVALSEQSWLDGPKGGPRLIADQWVDNEAQRLGAEIQQGGGLLPTLEVLSREDFDPSRLAQPVTDFYEHTSDWRLEVWSQWELAAWPFAWLLSRLFAHRLEQLSLPLHPLDVSRGMDSDVRRLVNREGIQVEAAWVRRVRSTGRTVYSGSYSSPVIPGAEAPCVRVVFPLPNGSVTVFLRPENGIGGSLRLVSPHGAFGAEGAYLIVQSRDGEKAWVRRVPIVETFTVYVDEEGVLRTDHALDLWRIPVIRLHYRIEQHQARG